MASLPMRNLSTNIAMKLHLLHLYNKSVDITVLFCEFYGIYFGTMGHFYKICVSLILFPLHVN
jgi:hypothetical protein